MPLSREQLLNYAKGNVPGQTAAQQADAQSQLGTSFPVMSTTVPRPATATTSTPVATTTTTTSNNSQNNSQAAVVQAQLADAQAQQAALQKWGLSNTNQIIKNSAGQWVPTPETQAQLDQIARISSQITQAGAVPVTLPTSPGLSNNPQVSATQAQLADLQAQQAALQKWGLSDTNQIVKNSAGQWVPTPETQAQLELKDP
jgi:hypothetical protein